MKALLLIALCIFTLNGYSHEHDYAGLKLGHQLHHKLTSSLVPVDIQRVNSLFPDKVPSRAHSYYFDDKTNTFYRCSSLADGFAKDDKNATCSDTAERGLSSSQAEYISKLENLYGKQDGMLPVSVLANNIVYFFEGKVPFQQITSYYYYAGKGKVTRCRTTSTTYNFDFLRNNELIYFQSEKEHETVAKCKQLYPRL